MATALALESMQSRKQEFVRNQIWDAAIDLFSEHGFENVTVDQIAQAAGVSRRSFFRYFASKDDLLGQGVSTFGDLLEHAIRTHTQAADLNPLALLRAIVRTVSGQITAEPRTRQVLEIAERSALARAAHFSRYTALEEQTANAYGCVAGLPPRLLASLTFSTIDYCLREWRRDPGRDIADLVDEAFDQMKKLTLG